MTTPDESISMENDKWKSNTLLLGALIGALTGLGAAYLLIQRADEEEGLQLTPQKGMKLGVTILGFLRQITNLG